jgi:hypothetical protein
MDLQQVPAIPSDCLVRAFPVMGLATEMEVSLGRYEGVCSPTFERNVRILNELRACAISSSLNTDRTYDSICPDCFRTIDTQAIAEDLAAKDICSHQDDFLPGDPVDINQVRT